MEDGEKSGVTEAVLDFSNLIDYEFTFEFRKLTKVLGAMFGVINDVRSEQSRTKADIELLFNHIKLIQSKPGFSDEPPPGDTTVAAAPRVEKVIDDGLLERFANVDNRLRTVEGKLAQLTSVQEVNKAKKLARDVESTMMRVQVLERVTSTAFANSAIKLSPEDLKRSYEEDAQARKLLEQPDDLEAPAVDAEESTDNQNSKPKTRATDKPRNGNDGTGGVDTFLALAKVEKVEAIVARMKAMQQEFQIRINQENHDRSREFHELKELIDESMQKAAQISVLVENSELHATKDLIEQAEAAALAALKQWQQDQIEEEQKKADQRFHAVQLQVRQLQNVLSEEKDIVADDVLTVAAPSGIDKTDLDVLRDMIRKVQTQSISSSANLNREMSILIQRVRSIQKAIDDIVSSDEQIELELKRSAEESIYNPTFEEAPVLNQPAGEAHEPESSQHVQEQKNPEPTVEESSQSSQSEAEPKHTSSQDSGHNDLKQLRGQIKQLLASDQAAKKVMVQYRLALQQMKQNLDKQKGELTRLSSFVYNHQQKPSPIAMPISHMDAASTISLSTSQHQSIVTSEPRPEIEHVLRDPFDLTRYSASHDQQQQMTDPPLSTSATSNQSTEETPSHYAIVVQEQKTQLLTPTQAEAVDPADAFLQRRHRSDEISQRPEVPDVNEAQSILAETKRWAQVINRELAEIRQDIACKPDVDSVMALFSIWKEQSALLGGESFELQEQAAPAAPQPKPNGLDTLATKIFKDVALKADRSDLMRLETRISLLADEIDRVKAFGLESVFVDDRDEIESVEMDNNNNDPANHGSNAFNSLKHQMNAMNMNSNANVAQQNWAAVRVFTKMQDRASTAALNKKIALIVQDIKRLTKTTGEIEEDIDTIRGLTMGIRKKISELETLHSSSDNNEDAIKDKTFIRTLRARIQLMITELDQKADRSELDSKADATDLNRLASQIYNLRRSTSIDRDLTDNGNVTETTTPRSAKLITGNGVGKLSRNSIVANKKRSIRPNASSSLNVASLARKGTSLGDIDQ